MKAELLKLLKTSWMGQEIEYFPVTDSTNQRIRTFAEAGKENGLLVIAEEQTGGKGSRGRSWVSPPGTGIWMSILLRPELEPTKASMITIVAALAIVKALEQTVSIPVKIKWPNDIVMNGKKVCGILTEMSADMEAVRYIIVGIGINANTENFPEDLLDRATSIFKESGKKIDRTALVAEFCFQFERYYERFLEAGNLRFLKVDYEAYLINIGKEVKIIKNKKEKIRRALGINELGGLIVEKEDGTKECVFSGEVSVRGLYGYV